MKLLAFVIGLCFIIGCSSVKVQHGGNYSAKVQDHPSAADRLESFDTSRLHRTRDKKVIIGGDTIIAHAQIRIYTEQSKGKGLKEYIQAGSRMPINEYDYNLNEDVYSYKQFYPNGALKQKGKRCWYGFYVGKWYYYDNKGKLTNTADFDDDYAFTWEDILKFCLKRNISLNKTTSGPATTVYKKIIKGKKLWIITYPDFSKDEYVTLMIDAYDGNVLGKRHAPFPIINS
ncbi:hypothetical protein [Mucilaginibacter sp.]